MSNHILPYTFLSLYIIICVTHSFLSYNLHTHTHTTDAEWFDENNRDELPTKVANSMVHISGAIGRQIADLFSNMWSSAGCLAVAMVLNAPLALIMLLIVPVVVICIAIFSCFIRKASKKSGHAFSSAGGLATEVLAGIKTVAALCAEPWALLTYGKHVETAQRSSVWGGFLTALSTGVTSLLFYITYTFAFYLGTEQVANNSSVRTNMITIISSNDLFCTYLAPALLTFDISPCTSLIYL